MSSMNTNSSVTEAPDTNAQNCQLTSFLVYFNATSEPGDCRSLALQPYLQSLFPLYSNSSVTGTPSALASRFRISRDGLRLSPLSSLTM
jgi:hypothetical protein